MKVSLGIATLVTLLSFHANAQSSWVDRLQNPRGGVCCFDNDGHRLEDPDWDTSKVAGYPFKVKRNGEWVDVPEWAVVTMKNQDGIARVWWGLSSDSGQTVRCFLPGSLS